MRATITGVDGSATEILDDDYDFEQQLWRSIDEIQLHDGDRVGIECTLENDTGRTLHWGDSALDEMCFLKLSVYPALGYGARPCSD